jgi:hypothetical protein
VWTTSEGTRRRAGDLASLVGAGVCSRLIRMRTRVRRWLEANRQGRPQGRPKPRTRPSATPKPSQLQPAPLRAGDGRRSSTVSPSAPGTGHSHRDAASCWSPAVTQPGPPGSRADQVAGHLAQSPLTTRRLGRFRSAARTAPCYLPGKSSKLLGSSSARETPAFAVRPYHSGAGMRRPCRPGGLARRSPWRARYSGAQGGRRSLASRCQPHQHTVRRFTKVTQGEVALPPGWADTGGCPT